MALIECYECKKRISDKANACPHCGAPKLLKSKDIFSLKPNLIKKIIKPLALGFIGLGLITIPIIGFTSFSNMKAEKEASIREQKSYELLAKIEEEEAIRERELLAKIKEEEAIREREILAIVSRRCAQYEFQDEIDYCERVYSPSNKEVTNFSYLIDSKTKPSYINEALDFYEKAWRKYRSEDYSGALYEANQYIKMVPYDYLAINDMGVLLAVGFNKYEESIEQFSKAIEINPNHNWAYLNRARSEIDLGNYDKGIKDIEKHLSILPNDNYALEELEIAKRKIKRRKALKGWAGFFEIINQAVQGYNQGRWGGGYQPNYESIDLQNRINSQQFLMNQQMNMQQHNMRMQQHNFNMQQHNMRMRDTNPYTVPYTNPY